MAKEPGNVRCSTWVGDPYTINGERRNYHDLPENRKNVIKAIQKGVENDMWQNLKNKTVTLPTDDGDIDVGFNRRDVNHIAKDALRTLSGKYFSRTSLVNIDRILSNSKHVPTSHKLYKGRTNDRTKFFRYTDSDGRGVYFKVGYRSNPGDGKHYTLHALTDIPP